MAGLDDIVTVSITTEGAQVTRKGFGIALILGATQKFADLVRFYTDLAGMVADGFGATDPEYMYARALFAQSPRPPQVAVGRRQVLPTLRFTLTPTAQNTCEYVVSLNSVDYAFTSDADATPAEIVTGLSALINADAGAPAAATGTNTLILTAKTAGAAFKLEVNRTDLLSIACDNADPGVTGDLDAIALENNDWYAIVSIFRSKAEIQAIAAWVESHGKLFITCSSDTGIIGAGNTDVASALKTSAYARTAIAYHPSSFSTLDAAWAGKCLPLDPGSETWKFKTLAGVPVTTLTTTQQNYAKGKYCNVYVQIAGVNITSEGVVAANEYIDVIRFRDWLKARIQERVFARLASAKKVPFTDPGVAIIEAEVRAQLREGVTVGGLSADPAPAVTVPRVADVSNVDKAARNLPNVTFTGVLAGAIHKLAIAGVVSV